MPGVGTSSDVPRATAGTAVMLLTLYVDGTGTSGARYAGVEQAASGTVSAIRILRMTATLVPHRQRWTPRMERLYAFRFRCGLLPAPIDDATDEHVEEWCEEKSEEGDTKHSGEHRDAHHPPHLRARSTRNDEWNDARNERKGGHQNRTQSDPCRLESATRRRSRKPGTSVRSELLRAATTSSRTARRERETRAECRAGRPEWRYCRP